MAGHGGGAWKVAYADFVTAMMAFFLVMWITGQSKAVSEAIAQYFNDPWQTSPKPTGDAARGSALLPTTSPARRRGRRWRRRGSPARWAANGAPGSRIQAVPPPPSRAAPPRRHAHAARRTDRPSSPSTTATRGAWGRVLFDEGGSGIGRSEQATAEAARPGHSRQAVQDQMRGHATQKSLSPGAAQDAWRLSYARCLATMSFLQQQGVAAERFRLSQGGPYEPYSIDQTPAKQAYNSRVEVYMLSRYAEELMGTPEERTARFTNQ